MSDEKAEMEGLSKAGIRTVDFNWKMKTIDILVAYGDESIPYITKIMESTISEDVKTYGLKKIEELKRK